VYVEHLEVHERGETWADVTEGNQWPRPFGLVWERLKYDWSQPSAVRGTVLESNLFKPGSTWEIHASPAAGGGSRIEIIAVRRLKGRGRLLWPLFPLRLAHRDVSAYLTQFLSKIETT
jgi:hypothetical protein